MKSPLGFDSLWQQKRFSTGICTEIFFVKYNEQIQATMSVNDRKQNFQQTLLIKIMQITTLEAKKISNFSVRKSQLF